MNTWQITRQLRHLLKSATWTDSPNEQVFSLVIVSDLSNFELLDKLDAIPPYAVVRSPSADGDRQNPLLQKLSMTVDVITIQENDPYGEAVILGGNHTVTNGASDGKGLAQIEQEVFNVVADLGQLNGVRHSAIVRSARGQSGGPDNAAWAIRTYTLEVFNYQEEYCSLVSGLAGVQNGSNVDLTWTDPPSRYDRFNIVIRRGTNSGDAAPTSVTGGTSVGTASIGDQAITDTAPGIGTWNYSVFAAYDASYRSTPTTATHYSDPVTVQVVVS